MSILSTIFSSGAKEIVSSVGDILDKNITNKEEKAKAKESLINSLLGQLNQLFKAQSEVLKVELQGNWLQKSWRPILMLSFGFIIMYYYFIAPVFSTPGIELPIEFWELLKIGVGGYVIGRSAEKIATSINVNDLFKKNK